MGLLYLHYEKTFQNIFESLLAPAKTSIFRSGRLAAGCWRCETGAAWTTGLSQIASQTFEKLADQRKMGNKER